MCAMSDSDATASKGNECFPEQEWEELIAAVTAAGGFVSPKLKRCQTQVSATLGMFATEAINEGEVLVRIPQQLAISHISMAREMPEVYNGVVKCCGGADNAEQAQYLGVTTCIAKLLGQAREGLASTGSVAGSAGRTDLDNVENVWLHASRILSRLDFTDHPYLYFARDAEFVQKHLAPSPELDRTIATVNDIPIQYARILEALGHDILTSHLTLDLFWQAFVSFHTRCFLNDGVTMLIPVIDLFNHSPDAGCEVVPASQTPDEAPLCDSLVAACAHAPGDELTICYKSHLGNPSLFRIYGFTLPPDVEPTCSFCLQLVMDDSPQFPAGLGELNITWSISSLDDSLLEALKACHRCGHDAREFVVDLCRRCREPYESDQSLQPALAALTRLRLQEPTSGAWWTCMPGSRAEIQGLARAPEFNGVFAEIICWEQDSNKWRVRLPTGKQARLLPENLKTADVANVGIEPAGSDPWKEHCVRVKMSEYLCLTAYIETAQLALGQLNEQQCLETGLIVMLVETFKSLEAD